MRISLVVPTRLYKFKYPAPLSMSDFPVGLAYIAGSLKAAGHEVFGCNPNNLYDYANAKEMANDVIVKHLKEFQPDIVATGGLCTDYAFLRDCISIVRKNAPHTPIMLGGGIVSYDPDFIFEHLKPDFAVKGDGEHISVQIAAALKNNLDLKDVNNILYWKDGKKVVTAENFRYPPIESIPYPEFDIFNAKDILDRFSPAARALYRYPHENGKTWFLVAGRGCPFRCTFCVHDRPTPYHVRSPEDVMKELVYFHGKYDFNVITIFDELFAPKRSRLLEFSAAMKKMREEQNWDLKWCFQTHANVGLTKEDLQVAKDAGCYMFSYGIESGSATVIKSMKKKSDPKTIREVIPVCHEVGIGFGGNLIFGDPAETPGTIAETMDFFRKCAEGIWGFMAPIAPYPGSTLYVNCRKDGTIPDPVEYYETIDERRFLMAKFPPKIWSLWIKFMSFYGNRGLHHKGARAVMRKREISKYFDTMYLDTQCPHCDAKFTYRHAEAPNQGRMENEGKLSLGTRLQLWAKDKPWFAWLVMRFVGLVALKYPWFGFVKDTVPIYRRTDLTIQTGCPECNRCIRLEWDPPRRQPAPVWIAAEV